MINYLEVIRFLLGFHSFFMLLYNTISFSNYRHPNYIKCKAYTRNNSDSTGYLCFYSIIKVYFGECKLIIPVLFCFLTIRTSHRHYFKQNYFFICSHFIVALRIKFYFNVTLQWIRRIGLRIFTKQKVCFFLSKIIHSVVIEFNMKRIYWSYKLKLLLLQCYTHMLSK